MAGKGVSYHNVSWNSIAVILNEQAVACILVSAGFNYTKWLAFSLTGCFGSFFLYLCFDKQSLFVVIAVFYLMTNEASRNTELLHSITKFLFTLACRFLLLNPNIWILSFPASVSFKIVDSFSASLVFCCAWNVAVDGEEVWLIGKELFISRKALVLALEKWSKITFLVRSTFFFFLLFCHCKASLKGVSSAVCVLLKMSQSLRLVSVVLMPFGYALKVPVICAILSHTVPSHSCPFSAVLYAQISVAGLLQPGGQHALAAMPV